jgi:predicted amidophosphoribosyltransferase
VLSFVVLSKRTTTTRTLVAVLHLLFPQRCVGCSRSGSQLCEMCRRALPRLGWPCCERCGAPGAWPVRRCVECTGRRLAFASARAAVAYDERVRRLVGAWKEHGLRRLAFVAADLVVEVVAPPDVEALTFVPGEHDRTLRRGEHPAQRLARELAERWELPAAAFLRRARAALPQRGSSLAERRRNVRGTFAPAAAAPRRVGLVDDVYTSGATAHAAAAALRKGGARHVEVVTFARTLRLR